VVVKNDTISDEVSFRGLGYVEINGILMPVCGSRRFNVGRNAKVRWLDEQIERAKAEEERKAVFEVYCQLTDPTSTVRLATGRVTGGKVLLQQGYEEGLPRGIVFDNTLVDGYWLCPPFRWVIPSIMSIENPKDGDPLDPYPKRRTVDQLSPIMYPDSFDDEIGPNFFTYIWMP